MATPTWRHWLASAADVVWPRSCCVCGRPDPDTDPDCPVCPTCRTALTTDPNETCPRCTSTVGPHTDVSNGCARCKGTKFRFTSAVRLGPYDGLLKDVILRMKSAAGEPLAEVLGEVWAAARRDELLAGNPGTVVPVPLHWRRRWDRGYNQATTLARDLAGGLGLPVRPGAVVRVRPTPTQRAQTPTERWENVKNAFRPGRWAGVSGMTVLLVDDVMTTGATADAAAAALLAAGAAQVRLAVAAHR